MSPAAVEMADGDVSLDDWIQGIGGEANLLFKIYRIEPDKYAGKLCKGHLGDVTSPPSEESINERWGGGKIQIKVFDGQTKKQKTSKTIYIVGNPKFDDEVRNGNGRISVVDATPEDPSLVSKAMTMHQEAAERERQRAEDAEARVRETEDKLRTAGKLDTDMLDRLMSPLQAQLSALKDELRAERELRAATEKDHKAELERARNEINARRGEDAGTLTNMVASEQNRLGALRSQHESELRALRERQDAELRLLREQCDRSIARIEDQRKDDATRAERDRDRALAQAEKSATERLESQKMAYESRLDTVKMRVADLERALTKVDVENAELRSRKEKTLLDSANELAGVKEALNETFGGGEKEEEGTFDKVMKMAGPILQGIGARIENQPARPQQQQQRRPQQRQQRRPPQQGQPQQAQPGQPQGPRPPQIKLKREEVNLAVAFMEGAIGNKTPPEAFAETARGTVPANVIQALRYFGPDRFLTEVAQVPANSLLLTVQGRRFVRKVLAVLLGPTAEDLPPMETAMEAAPVPPSEDLPPDPALDGGLDPVAEAAAAAASVGEEVFT